MTYEHRQRRESVDKQVAYGIVALEVLYPLLALALLTSDIDDVEEVAIELELDLLGADGEATGPQYVLVGGLVIRVGNAVEVLEIAAPDLKSRAQHPAREARERTIGHSQRGGTRYREQRPP